jgi:hypothetical protein
MSGHDGVRHRTLVAPIGATCDKAAIALRGTPAPDRGDGPPPSDTTGGWPRPSRSVTMCPPRRPGSSPRRGPITLVPTE